MLSFVLAGSKNIDTSIIKPEKLPWMTNFMFAELDALSRISPFTEQNLVQHIAENPELWDRLYKRSNINFTELPNRNLFDIGGMIGVEI
jgi:hypothetical protein